MFALRTARSVAGALDLDVSGVSNYAVLDAVTETPLYKNFRLWRPNPVLLKHIDLILCNIVRKVEKNRPVALASSSTSD